MMLDYFSNQYLLFHTVFDIGIQILFVWLCLVIEISQLILSQHFIDYNHSLTHAHLFEWGIMCFMNEC